jgi:hypothetical protein
MKLEIYNDGTKIDFDNIIYKDFIEETTKKRELLTLNEVDFSSITKLKGSKDIMELAFQQEKLEHI